MTRASYPPSSDGNADSESGSATGNADGPAELAYAFAHAEKSESPGIFERAFAGLRTSLTWFSLTR